MEIFHSRLAFNLQLKATRSVTGGSTNGEDFIDIDGQDSGASNEFWKRVQTRRAIAKRPPQLTHSELTQTSVKLDWSVDPCANDYIIQWSDSE